MAKKKIVIIGGGPAALATAYELSATQALRAQFSVSIYTPGWRLGGKCASSRDPAHRYRNEEHGLHVLGGFYHNTFQILDALYAAWPQAAPGRAIAREDAIIPHESFTVMQRSRARKPVWQRVTVDFPPTRGMPGVDPQPLSLPLVFRRLLNWTANLWTQSFDPALLSLAPPSATELLALDAPRTLANLAADADVLMQPEPPGGDRDGALARLDEILRRVNEALDKHADEESGPALSTFTPLTDAGDPAITIERPGLGNADWIALIGLSITVARGLLFDRIAKRGFDCVNHLDAQAWLAGHGASKRVIQSCFVQSGYHYAFAFVDGDPARADFAAGVALRGLLRMFFTYEGSVFQHMNGGMGEIFVTPFYDVLKARGVAFHFFHKAIDTSAAAGRLERIVLRMQARVRAGSDRYDPLIQHEARGVWPARPLLDQLSEAPQDAATDDWSYGGDGVASVELRQGRDFDLAVFAAPPPALARFTAPLSAHSTSWRSMLQHATTTPTLAAQLWFTGPPNTLGGAHGGIATAYETPLSTWADMSFLLDLEKPPANGEKITALSYFCGPCRLADGDADAQTTKWLAKHGGPILPGLGAPDNANAEIERLSRINASPADLYMLSPAGSIDARMPADDTGFKNLLVAGDWTRNGADVGAVEAAIMSGRQAARAISGFPRTIYGEKDFG